jgi:hypothetical protein
MPQKLPAGPYDELDLGGGAKAPFYIIPFDKKGRVTGPQTRQHLIEAVQAGGFSDLFLFSHGWNNDWKVSSQRYRDFIAGFQTTRQEQGITMPDGYKPILVGIFWPSTALVFGDEKGPDFAAAGLSREQKDAEVADALAEVDDIAARLASEQEVNELYDLAHRETLEPAQARRLAALIAPLYADEDDPARDGPLPAGAETMDAEALLTAWRALEAQEQPAQPTRPGGAFGFPTDEASDQAGAEAPGLAGLSSLNPRKVVRMFTVWKMKDRAGVVGGKGVSPLLRDLLAASDATRCHLLGHSYGCKVVLSALAGLPAASRPVDSLLLLQPAVNRWCFADEVPKRGGRGAYHNAPARCRLPVFTTFSKNDVALHDSFHLAVRRGSDLGEGPALAAKLDAPSIYCALGGYGPAGRDAETRVVELLQASDAYDFDQGGRIFALRSDDRITGHGDISNPWTWWTLHQLVRRAAHVS